LLLALQLVFLIGKVNILINKAKLTFKLVFDRK